MLAALGFAACAPEAKVEHVELPAPLPPPPAVTASASAPAPATRFFPEDPTLDAVAIRNAAFVQETWTGASTWQQHCIEWGLLASREDAVRDATNALLAPRGIHIPDKSRVQGLVVVLAKFVQGVVVREPLVKLVVCTEGVAPKSEHDVFAARLLADPRAPRLAAFQSLGAPDVAWNRVHSNGEVEFGFRYPNLDPIASTRAAQAIEAAHDDRFHTRLIGRDLWWTGLRVP